jgi:radical SAM protein
VDLDSRPILVFWESTRACLLACRHCRAEAQAAPVPGELTTEESLRFIDSLAAFERPAPILVITGGDALMRHDLSELVAHAREVGVPVALAPSVTPLLTDERLAELRRLGVKVASLSLDGASAATHEGMRGVEGHFAETLDALRRMRALGLVVQVNTVVTAENVEELPQVARIVRDGGASIWEVFFLVNVGRGTSMSELGPNENEDVCQFLYDASRYGFIVRTVEGPMFRRVVAWREEGRDGPVGSLYTRLSQGLVKELGPPTSVSKAQTKGTRDGRGIVFVSSTGDVYPAGFLPLVLGNVKEQDIVELYRGHPLLRQLRAAAFHGKCGRCEYRELCGGSRSRAYAASGDPLAEDPACAFAVGA